jgi:hypothetical protein
VTERADQQTLLEINENTACAYGLRYLISFAKVRGWWVPGVRVWAEVPHLLRQGAWVVGAWGAAQRRQPPSMRRSGPTALVQARALAGAGCRVLALGRAGRQQG